MNYKMVRILTLVTNFARKTQKLDPNDGDLDGVKFEA